jgi:formate dehydrogenase maturation protein FdhE
MRAQKMISFWDRQIERADRLAAESSGPGELLSFYARLLRAQQEIYEYFRSRNDSLPSGDLQKDLPAVLEASHYVLQTVSSHGPTVLASEAGNLVESGEEAIAQILLSYWHDPSDIQFFAKAILQPYMRWLIDSGATPADRGLANSPRTCPFCGGNPQVSYLQAKESNAESGNRDLICATCLSSWEFRRVICANCGEESPAKLGYFHSPEFDHIRIEACDTCKHYIKGVDLTRLGFAAPLVDEIYAASLDLWAREHGYRKIELNLVGV